MSAQVQSITTFSWMGITRHTSKAYPTQPHLQPPILQSADGEINGACICPYTQSPPKHAVHLLIPNEDGTHHPQVFELESLFRAIATIGICRQARQFCHPINLQRVCRIGALERVIQASPLVRRQCLEERARLASIGQPCEEPPPITGIQVQMWKDAMTLVRSNKSLPDEDDYAQMDFGPPIEGQINPDGGAPIHVVDLAAAEAAEAAAEAEAEEAAAESAAVAASIAAAAEAEAEEAAAELAAVAASEAVVAEADAAAIAAEEAAIGEAIRRSVNNPGAGPPGAQDPSLANPGVAPPAAQGAFAAPVARPVLDEFFDGSVAGNHFGATAANPALAVNGSPSGAEGTVQGAVEDNSVLGTARRRRAGTANSSVAVAAVVRAPSDASAARAMAAEERRRGRLDNVDADDGSAGLPRFAGRNPSDFQRRRADVHRMIHQDDEDALSRGSEPPRNFRRTVHGGRGAAAGTRSRRSRSGAPSARRGATTNLARARDGARTPTPTTNTSERGQNGTASSSASWAAGTTASEPRQRVADDDPDWDPSFTDLFDEPSPCGPRRHDRHGGATRPPAHLVSVPASHRALLASQSQANPDEDMMDDDDVEQDVVSGCIALPLGVLAVVCSPILF